MLSIKKDLLAALAAGLDELSPGAGDKAAFESPKVAAHGDFACTAAMQLAKPLKLNPRQLAESLRAILLKAPAFERWVDAIEIAGPGFINIRLKPSAKQQIVREVLGAGARFGIAEPNGQKLMVEFVSANPTGPLHVGHGRNAALGDSISNLLQTQGAQVQREFYYNDAGVQINNLAVSVQARAQGLTPDHAGWPADGYRGDYILDVAQAYLRGDTVAFEDYVVTGGKDPADLDAIRRFAVAWLRNEQTGDLAAYGVGFDVYFLESSLYSDGKVEETVRELIAHGHTYEEGGALWLRSTDFGDDKDRVIVKSDGEAAYIAGDLAYYLDKRERGFNRVVIMLGADHHGYIGRMMAMCAAFGDTPWVNLEILIGQMVNLVKGGVPMKMSKRAGTIVTIDDLVDAVGVDAARYSLARSSADQSIDLDLDLLARATNENPVYYVQYAHARTVNVGRNALELGVRREDGFDPSLLDHVSESTLLAKLGELGRVIAQAAELREPHRVARYLEELAGAYHKWYDQRRVSPFGDEEVTDVHRTRLWLNDATRTVLANGLELLGVSAPERM